MKFGVDIFFKKSSATDSLASPKERELARRLQLLGPQIWNWQGKSMSRSSENTATAGIGSLPAAQARLPHTDVVEPKQQALRRAN